MNELTIETLQVEIKVIRVGGHKMTISVFEQIEYVDLADMMFHLECDDRDTGTFLESLQTLLSYDDCKPLGWVRYKKMEYLLFTYGDYLRKLRVSERREGTKDFGYDADVHSFVRGNFSQLFIAT